MADKEGTIRENANGDRIILRSGRWEPVGQQSAPAGFTPVPTDTRSGIDVLRQEGHLGGFLPQVIKDVGGQFAQGMTFGRSDEMAGDVAARRAFFSGQDIDMVRKQATEQARTELQAGGERIGPIGSFLADTAGGLVTGFGGAQALRGAPFAEKVARFGRNHPFLSAMGIGSGVGALEGSGRAVEGKKAEGAAFGGGLGLLFGPLGPLMTKGIGKMIARKTPQRVLLESLEQGGISPQAAQQKLSQLGPNAVLADIAPSTQNLIGETTRSAPKALNEVTEALEKRVQGAPSRLSKALRTVLKNDKNARLEIENLIARRKELSKPLYDQAFAQNVSEDAIRRATSKMDDLIADNADTAIGRAVKTFKSKLTRKGEVKTSVKQLDALKRDLDDKIGTAVTRKQGNKVRVLTEAKEALINEIDNEVPVYKQARDVFSKDARVIDAVKAGQRILKDDADDIAFSMQKMTDQEREAFRTGAVSAVDKALEDVNIGSDASRKLIRNQTIRNKLANAFDNAEDLDNFINQAEAERAFTATRNLALKGSMTAMNESQRKIFLKRMGVPKEKVRALTNAQIGDVLFKGTKESFDEDMAVDVARLLMSKGTDADKVLNEVAKKQSKFTPQQKELFSMVRDILSGQLAGQALE